MRSTRSHLPDAFAAQRLMIGVAQRNVAAALAGEAAGRHAVIDAATREAIGRVERASSAFPTRLQEAANGALNRLATNAVAAHDRVDAIVRSALAAAAATAERALAPLPARERAAIERQEEVALSCAIVSEAVEAVAAAVASIMEAGAAAGTAMRRCTADYAEAAATRADAAIGVLQAGRLGLARPCEGRLLRPARPPRVRRGYGPPQAVRRRRGAPDRRRHRRR